MISSSLHVNLAGVACTPPSAIHLIHHLCVQAQEVQRPTVLAADIRRLITLVHQIAPLTGLHASVLVREALLTCACDDTWANRQTTSKAYQQQPSKAVLQQQLAPPQLQNEQQEAQQSASASVPVIASIAEWYMTTVVRDQRNLGVSVSRAR